MVPSKCNLRFILTLCAVVVVVETLALLICAGYVKVWTVDPNSVLQKGWAENSNLPTCHYGKSIIKEQQQLSCYLFVAVMVRPSGFDRREVIRKTWYRHITNHEHSLTQVRFFVGTRSLSKQVLEGIHKEQETHHDIVMLDEHVDTYERLTWKSIQTMTWIIQHVNFTYYLKCDDDSYPLVNHIISELQERRQTGRLYWGHFFIDLHVHKSGKNVDNSWFLTKQYTPFAIGGAYILSSDLVQLVVGMQKCLHYYQNEDVTLGLWLSPYHIERKHDYRFCRRSQTCLPDTIIFLGRSKEQLLSLSEKL